MTTLTKAQRSLLTQAAASQTGAIEVHDASPATVSSLIRQGCLIAIPAAEGPSRLIITELGRAAIGLSDDRPSLVDGTPTPDTPIPKGKIGALVVLLKRPEGATIAELMGATGWQAHSMRGAISGSIKKAMGLEVISEKIDGQRVYRVLVDATA